MTIHELAFQNSILITSGLVAIIMIPVTLINLAIQFSSSKDRNLLLQEYNTWRKCYNYQIIIFGGIGMYFLHPLVGAIILFNIITWFAGDLYRSCFAKEVKNV